MNGINRRQFLRYSGLSIGTTICSGGRSVALFGQNPSTVRVCSLSGGMSAVAANLLVRSGATQKRGLNVELRPFGSDVSVQNFLQGLAEVSFDFGPSQVALAWSRFPTAVINSVQCSQNAVIARTDSGIEKMEDLLNFEQRHGRKPRLGIFGRDSSNFNELTVLLAVKFGVNRPRMEQTFDLVEASPPGLIPLLSRGDIDAATLFDPLVLRAELDANARIVFGPYAQEFEAIWGAPKILAGITVQVDFLRKNLDLMKHFREAWIETVEWASSNGYEFFREDRFKQLTGIRENSAINRLIERNIKLPLFTARWDQAMKQTQLNYLKVAAQQGILPSIPDTPMTDLENFI